MPIRLSTKARDYYEYPLLIKHLLHTPLATSPNQEIVYRDRSRYTYLTLRDRIGRLATALQSLGVTAGTTVAVMDWDSHRYLECFFAIPMMGAVLQTVNVRLSPEQICYTLRHAEAEALIVHGDFIPLLAEIRGQVPSLKTIIEIREDSTNDGGCEPPFHEYESLIKASKTDYLFEDFDENAIATTFYTTGTTGDPKGVCFSHRQLVLHTLALLCACASPAHGQSFRHGDVYMPMTPMFHVHAWGFPYVATLLGVKQVYPGRYVPAEILKLRERESVTYSHCVPTILQMLLKEAASAGADLSGWKLTVGGAALPAGLAREALRNGIDVHAGYGMSETGPVLALSRLLDPARHPASDEEIERRCRTGLPIPLVDLKIVDASNGTLPRHEDSAGELVVRAPWLTPCYIGNASASNDLWSGGYLHTQDVARIDAQGYVQITDRIKDVIKTGGEWISSLQLENLISRHPAVAEVAVIGVPDALWGERPHALVVPKAGLPSAGIAEDIRALIATAASEGHVPRYAVPDRVTFVEVLDRTSVGKINKRALRERYCQ